MTTIIAYAIAVVAIIALAITSLLIVVISAALNPQPSYLLERATVELDESSEAKPGDPRLQHMLRIVVKLVVMWFRYKSKVAAGRLDLLLVIGVAGNLFLGWPEMLVQLARDLIEAGGGLN